VYRKLRFGRIGGAVRRPGHATRCVRSAEPDAKSAHPWLSRGAFSRSCNSSHKTSGPSAIAVRPGRGHGPRTRYGLIQAASQRSSSAKGGRAQRACCGCPSLAAGRDGLAVDRISIADQLRGGIVTLLGLPAGMVGRKPSIMTRISYAGYRFPPVIIQQAVWLYARFTLSFRDVQDLLAERGMMVSYETVCRWVEYFEPKIAADLRRAGPSPIPRGILMRRLSRSTAGWSTYGVPSMPKAKSSMFLFRASGTSGLH
jgi:hypothetical protein